MFSLAGVLQFGTLAIGFVPPPPSSSLLLLLLPNDDDSNHHPVVGSSCFSPSPFDDAAVRCRLGVGAWFSLGSALAYLVLAMASVAAFRSGATTGAVSTRTDDARTNANRDTKNRDTTTTTNLRAATSMDDDDDAGDTTTSAGSSFAGNSYHRWATSIRAREVEPAAAAHNIHIQPITTKTRTILSHRVFGLGNDTHRAVGSIGILRALRATLACGGGFRTGIEADTTETGTEGDILEAASVETQFVVQQSGGAGTTCFCVGDNPNNSNGNINGNGTNGHRVSGERHGGEPQSGGRAEEGIELYPEEDDDRQQHDHHQQQNSCTIVLTNNNSMVDEEEELDRRHWESVEFVRS